MSENAQYQLRAQWRDRARFASRDFRGEGASQLLVFNASAPHVARHALGIV